jgi:hypothetical protein
MKFLLTILFLISFNAFAECTWSKKFPILNNTKLSFQECKEQKKIRINQIEVKPSIGFDIVHPYYPEGNTIWSKVSPDEKTAIVWIENNQFERNIWIINLTNNSIELSISSLAEGRHLFVNFSENDKFIITIAGMGYKKENTYRKVEGLWQK